MHDGKPFLSSSDDNTYQFSRKNRTVWWPVKINIPQDNGEVNTVTVQMLLNIPKRSEAKKASGMPAKEFEEYMLNRVEDWRGIVDEESGAPIPFSKEHFADLMDDAYFEAAVTAALMQAAVGARVKN